MNACPFPESPTSGRQRFFCALFTLFCSQLKITRFREKWAYEQYTVNAEDGYFDPVFTQVLSRSVLFEALLVATSTGFRRRIAGEDR